jgi:hypothetical protein
MAESEACFGTVMMNRKSDALLGASWIRGWMERGGYISLYIVLYTSRTLARI